MEKHQLEQRLKEIDETCSDDMKGLERTMAKIDYCISLVKQKKNGNGTK